MELEEQTVLCRLQSAIIQVIFNDKQLQLPNCKIAAAVVKLLLPILHSQLWGVGDIFVGHNRQVIMRRTPFSEYLVLEKLHEAS